MARTMLAALVLAWTTSVVAAQPPGVAGVVSRDDIPPKIKAFLEECETSRRGSIRQLEFELRGLRARNTQSPATARRIKKTEANLRALRDNKEPVVPALRFPPEVGDIGRIPRLTCHTDQILSDDEMLVRCHFSIRVRTVKNFRPQLETVVRPVSFLIRGLPTDPFTDGTDVQLLNVFRISGKHTYRSVAGKPITVQVLAPFDLRAIEPYFQAMKAGR
jgi:hypothetical protein